MSDLISRLEMAVGGSRDPWAVSLRPLLWEAASALRRASNPPDEVGYEGWRLVPIVTTEAMEDAGAKEIDPTNPYPRDVVANIWDAMLRAAPKAELDRRSATNR